MDPTQSLEELAEFLRIPSISADPGHRADVRDAAEWVAAKIRRSGGDAEILDWHGSPLVVGEIRASGDAAAAPTVLCYGHFDVQPPDPVELWETEPFEPTVTDGWLCCRGVADDKGQLWMLLEAAARLAAEGRLPVNVRFICDGEEEVGGSAVVEFIAADERGADVAVIFDAPYLRRGVPAMYISVRGICYFHVTVRTGARDLHSGEFGGAALNGLEALMATLGGVLPAPNGLLPEPLRRGIAPVTAEELEGWRQLPPGADVLAESGARPLDATAADELYVRTWAEPAVTVHGLAGGSPHLQKTVLPVVGEANVSIRIVAGQRPDEIVAAMTRLLEASAPAGAEVEVDVRSAGAGALISPDAPAMRIALDAFEQAIGTRPVLVRGGGTLPIMTALTEHGVPTVLSGFNVPEGNVHAPNERMLLGHFPLGLSAARELLLRYRTLG